MAQGVVAVGTILGRALSENDPDNWPRSWTLFRPWLNASNPRSPVLFVMLPTGVLDGERLRLEPHRSPEVPASASPAEAP